MEQSARNEFYRKAEIYGGLTHSALHRMADCGFDYTHVEIDKNGKETESITRRVSCDFQQAEHLKTFDNKLIPRIKKLFEEARNSGFNDVEKFFTPESLYAINVIGNVTKYGASKISQLLKEEAAKKRGPAEIVLLAEKKAAEPPTAVRRAKAGDGEHMVLAFPKSAI